VGYGIYGLAGGDVRGEPVEFIVALLVGAIAAPFCGSAALLGRLTLTDNAIVHAPIGSWFRPRRVAFAAIERWGVGEEKGGGGGTHTVLVLDLTDGRRVGFKIEMYEDHDRVAGAIAERSGKPPVPMKTTFSGAKFDEDSA